MAVGLFGFGFAGAKVCRATLIWGLGFRVYEVVGVGVFLHCDCCHATPLVHSSMMTTTLVVGSVAVAIVMKSCCFNKRRRVSG